MGFVQVVVMMSRTSACTDCLSGGGRGRTASGDRSVQAIFLGGKLCGSVALASHVFLEGNHIRYEQ